MKNGGSRRKLPPFSPEGNYMTSVNRRTTVDPIQAAFATPPIWANHVGGERKDTAMVLVDLTAAIASSGLPLFRMGKVIVAMRRDGQRAEIDNFSKLRSWLEGQQVCRVDWREKDKLSKSEAYQAILDACAVIDGVFDAPHWPPIHRHLYACPRVEPVANGAIDAFLDFFCPATPVDRELLRALVLTAFWGGELGQRPFFLITAPGEGIQTGKSTLIELIAALRGETPIDFSTRDGGDEVGKRLLSAEAQRSTTLRFDNVKANVLSSDWLESKICSENFSGRKLYEGEGKRANAFLWTATANDPNLSADLASRGVVIQLERPRSYVTDWIRRVRRFATDRRFDVWADAAAWLSRPVTDYRPDHGIRWGAWIGEVVARLENPNAVIEAIEARRIAVDADATLAVQLEQLLIERAGEQLNAPWSRLELTQDELCDAMSTITGRSNWQSVSQALARLEQRGRFCRIVRRESRGYPRYYLAADAIIHKAYDRLRYGRDMEQACVDLTAAARGGDCEARAIIEAAVTPSAPTPESALTLIATEMRARQLARSQRQPLTRHKH